jgi:hypothetical protein
VTTQRSQVAQANYAAAAGEPFDELEEPEGSLEVPPDAPPSDELGFAVASPDDGLSADGLSPEGLSPEGLFDPEL